MSQSVPKSQLCVLQEHYENTNTKVQSCWEDVIFENMRMGAGVRVSVLVVQVSILDNS